MLTAYYWRPTSARRLLAADLLAAYKWPDQIRADLSGVASSQPRDDPAECLDVGAAFCDAGRQAGNASPTSEGGPAHARVPTYPYMLVLRSLLRAVLPGHAARLAVLAEAATEHGGHRRHDDGLPRHGRQPELGLHRPCMCASRVSGLSCRRPYRRRLRHRARSFPKVAEQFIERLALPIAASS